MNSEIYVGSTNDLRQRMKDHNNGNVFSTKRYKPWTLIYYEAYLKESFAREREKKLKQHGNAKKELKKRIGLDKSGSALPSTTFLKKSGAGFTLIELMLSVSVIMIIAGMSAPIYQSFQVRNDLDIAAVSIAQSLRRVEILAQAVDGDTNWGVDIRIGSITVFKGASYATRDTAFDEVFEVPTSIAPSGIAEIVFTKFTGLPQTTGTMTLTSDTNETRTITINAKGMVSY